jgi:hypothetical protein
LPLSTLTTEEVQKLGANAAKLAADLRELQATPSEQLWLRDLARLELALPRTRDDRGDLVKSFPAPSAAEVDSAMAAALAEWEAAAVDASWTGLSDVTSPASLISERQRAADDKKAAKEERAAKAAAEKAEKAAKPKPKPKRAVKTEAKTESSPSVVTGSLDDLFSIPSTPDLFVGSDPVTPLVTAAAGRKRASSTAAATTAAADPPAKRRRTTAAVAPIAADPFAFAASAPKVKAEPRPLRSFPLPLPPLTDSSPEPPSPSAATAASSFASPPSALAGPATPPIAARATRAATRQARSSRSRPVASRLEESESTADIGLDFDSESGDSDNEAPSSPNWEPEFVE